MDPVTHFEIPAENTKRMSNFYSNVFGWQINQLGKDMGNYALITTTPIDKDKMPLNKGSINGGFYQKTPDKLTQSPSLVIAVKDINKSIEKIKKEGGKIIGKVTKIPGVGNFVSFFDIEGNKLSIIQPFLKEDGKPLNNY